MDKLRSEVANQRRTLKSQKETIEALQKEQKKEEMKTADVSERVCGIILILFSVRRVSIFSLN